MIWLGDAKVRRLFKSSVLFDMRGNINVYLLLKHSFFPCYIQFTHVTATPVFE
jgi:hypothetical protein